MRIERVPSGGLAHFSYFVADGRDAVVVDPRRDVDVYLERARQLGVTIRYVLETHRNEDYVIGSGDLARATGARVLHGRGLPWAYGEEVADGDAIGVGSLVLRALATPGHTRESLSYVLYERTDGPPLAVFTGDALFAGDVGRVDLYGPAHAEENARALFASLHARLLPLGDGVVVYPAHGGGSVCGAGIADRPITTIGYERGTSALLRLDEAAFVRRKLSERHVVPPYFFKMERWNLEGAPPLSELPVPRALVADEVETATRAGALVVDLRSAEAFAGGHVPGALSLWLAGVPSYGGWLLPDDRDKILVLEDASDLEEALRHLVRIGVERIAGYLGPGFPAWRDAGKPIARVGTLDVETLRHHRSEGWRPVVLDVRKPDEHAEGVLPGARLFFAGEAPARVGEVPGDRPVVVHCSVGNRASIVASILAANGHRQVWNLLGGMKAAEALGEPIVDPDAAELEAETRRLGARDPGGEGAPSAGTEIRVDDRFTVGPQPDEAKLRELAKQGFRTVVNFRTEGEEEQPLSPAEEGSLVRSLGLRYLHVPVDVKQLREEQVDTFRQQVDTLPGPIYAHCRTGMRSGAFVMIKKAIDEGMTGEQLVASAERMGFPCDKPEIESFVRKYVDARVEEPV